MQDEGSSLHSNATWCHTAYDITMNLYFTNNGVFSSISMILTLSKHLLTKFLRQQNILFEIQIITGLDKDEQTP